MPSSTRMGSETAKTRAALIKAAAQMGRSEGYASITARHLAGKVGLKRQIVHYYFRTIDDLLAAVVRFEYENHQRLFAKAVKSDEPLRAAVRFSRSITTMNCQFAALALRSHAIRDELKRQVVKLREREMQALMGYMERSGSGSQLPPAAAATFVLRCLAQSMSLEAAIGASNSHANIEALVEGWLRAIANKGASQPHARGVDSNTAPSTPNQPACVY